MTLTSPVRRVVLVVLDGLRPDAIGRFGLPTLTGLCETGGYTLSARTVDPSVTACAMTSLLTGAPPEAHGMQSDRITIPRPRGPLDPLPKVLRQHQRPTSAFMARIPGAFKPVARHVLRALGVDHCAFDGECSAEILAAARRNLREQDAGLIVMHWPDADRAGHSHGWMSREYEAAARSMDASLAGVVASAGLDGGSDTVLIVVADHGGGGAVADGHDSVHPADVTIPVVLAGRGVRPGPIARPVSLLDIAPSVLWALGIPQPPSYVGMPLTDAPMARRVAA